MKTLFTALGSLCSVYIFLVFLRILLSWFESGLRGRPYEILAAICDPWLNAFRGARFLRWGNMDFSPLLALGVLSIINSAFLYLGSVGHISLGIILSFLVNIVWSAVSFFCILFAIIALLYLLSYTVAKGSASPFWQVVRALGSPILYRSNRLIFRDRLVSYKTSAVSTIILCLVFKVGGDFLVGLLVKFLERSPL